MESAPDSALYALDSIDATEITNEHDRALYGLLLTQAREKNYYFEKDDSLISESVKYFDHHGDKGLSMKAHYYKGAVNFNGGNLTTALRENLEALSLAEELTDTLFMARAHDAIADAYHDLYNLEISIMHRKKACYYFKQANKENHLMYCLIDIAREYGSAGQPEKAIALLDSISENFITTDSVFKGFLLESYIQPLMKTGQYSIALEKHKQSRQFWNPAAYEMQNYSERAELFAKYNLPDSARYYLNLEIVTNSNYDEKIWFHSAKYELFKSEHSYDSALIELEKYADLTFKSVNQTLKNEASFTERDFHSLRANIEKEKADKYLSNFIYSFLLYLFLTIIFIIFHREKNEAKEDRNRK